jgi:Holliday junction resolvase RusA-like endonuclease
MAYRWTKEDVAQLAGKIAGGQSLIDVSKRGTSISPKSMKSNNEGHFILSVPPFPKPRMTARDKWKGRPVVLRYNGWKDALRIELAKLGINDLPAAYIHFTFHVSMPDSWSAKKRNEQDGKPHLCRPDIDNYLKAILDCIWVNDSHIWDIRGTKIWGREGKIEIKM